MDFKPVMYSRDLLKFIKKLCNIHNFVYNYKLINERMRYYILNL